MREIPSRSSARLSCKHVGLVHQSGTHATTHTQRAASCWIKIEAWAKRDRGHRAQGKQLAGTSFGRRRDPGGEVRGVL